MPAPAYPRSLAGQVGFVLARAHVVARANAERALAPLGLSPKAYGALATVAGEGPLSQLALSRRLGMDPATMVDVIDQLEHSGHVVRSRNPKDRREYALQPSATGKAQFERARRALAEAEAELLRGIRPDEAQTLVRLLRKIAGSPSDVVGTRDPLGG